MRKSFRRIIKRVKSTRSTRSLLDQKLDDKTELVNDTTAIGSDEESVQIPKKGNTVIDKLKRSIAADVLANKNNEPIEIVRSPFLSLLNGRPLEVPKVYCNQNSSNRSVASIEDYTQKLCPQLHSSAPPSNSGNDSVSDATTATQQTHQLVVEARQTIAKATNCQEETDDVLFAGKGPSSSVTLLIECMGLLQMSDEEKKPVVFFGPYERNANILPWREAGCETIMIPECQETKTVDVAALEQQLQDPAHADRLKIGTFAAVSNVSGKLSDVDTLAAVLHQNDALAFFDYDAAAPYSLNIDMNPCPAQQQRLSRRRKSLAKEVVKDAVFVSPHKMLGGVETPGVLLVKKHLIRQRSCHETGSAMYVTSTHHHYCPSDQIERYEKGTANIAGIARAGLTFLYRQHTEQRYARLRATEKSLPERMVDNEFRTFRHVRDRLSRTAPNLILLGSDSSSRALHRTDHLPIFSFLIRCGRRYLHYNYVSAILNDVFGIQSQSGCQSAGPYSQQLLGFTDDEGLPNEINKHLEEAIVEGRMGAQLIKPGFTRICLPFQGLRSEEVEYVIRALEWVANNGWALMCSYRCNPLTGEWCHVKRQEQERTLGDFQPFARPQLLPSLSPSAWSVQDLPLNAFLDKAIFNASEDVLQAARRNKQAMLDSVGESETTPLFDFDGGEAARWFVRPDECVMWLSQELTIPPKTNGKTTVGAIRIKKRIQMR